MNKSQAFEVMQYVTAVWTQREMTEAQIVAYVEAIEDLPFEAVSLAAKQLAMSEDWMPSIALLRTTAVEMLPGKKMPEADDAWGEVKEQIRKVGSLRGMENWNVKSEDGKPVIHEPTFTHPAIEQVVESMGWDELCMSENEVADRAHFMKMYDMAKERNRREQNMTPAAKQLQDAMTGMFELTDGE